MQVEPAKSHAPLRILITNNTMLRRAGSELYVRDLALALLRRGHSPIVYSPVLGPVAKELKARTVPVIDDLEDMSASPDIIHGHHHHETMTAVMRYPGVPAVFVCHGWLPWQEIPPAFPSILRYVAVDDLCRERLETTRGVPGEGISTLYNFVDLRRFSRVRNLPDRPGSALVFSNYAKGVPEAIVRACEAAGIGRVDVIGAGSGSQIPDPERILANYDIVFAKARAALEAMASGCAVIVMDYSGLAGMVTCENFDRLRKLNFGVRALQAQALDEDSVRAALARYDSVDARTVSLRVRDEAGLEAAADRWIDLYRDCLASDPSPSADTHLMAASRYLRFLAPYLKSWEEAKVQAGHAEAEARRLRADLAAIRASAAALDERDGLKAEADEKTQVLAQLTQRLEVADALNATLGKKVERLRSRGAWPRRLNPWRALASRKTRT